MKNKKTIKNIIIGLVVAILALGVYAAISGGSADQQSSTSSLSSLIGSGNFGEVQESNTDLANAEILRILGSVQNINLNDDIFKNPVFRELEDSRFTIPKPVQIGRPNPFLPIGFDSLVQVDTPTTFDDGFNTNFDAGTNNGVIDNSNNSDENSQVSNFFN